MMGEFVTIEYNKEGTEVNWGVLTTDMQKVFNDISDKALPLQ